MLAEYFARAGGLMLAAYIARAGSFMLAEYFARAGGLYASKVLCQRGGIYAFFGSGGKVAKACANPKERCLLAGINCSQSCFQT